MNDYPSYCCDSFEEARSRNTIGVQLQMIQYIFRIKILSKDTPSLERRDRLKNGRENEVEIRCSMSKTKYGECDMRWTTICKMNEMEMNDEMNELGYGT